MVGEKSDFSGKTNGNEWQGAIAFHIALKVVVGRLW
jgi:hypothetical protein